VKGEAPALYGSPAVPATVYLRSTGSGLPVEVTEVGGGTSAIITFSYWGKPFGVATPHTTLVFTSTK
jgi:hypothetical protein